MGDKIFTGVLYLGFTMLALAYAGFFAMVFNGASVALGLIEDTDMSKGIFMALGLALVLKIMFGSGDKE